MRRAGAHRADLGPDARLPGQQRRGGGRGVDQARPPRHGRPYWSPSWAASTAAPRARYPDGVQVQVPRRLRPAAPGVYHAPFGTLEGLRWFDEVLFDKLVPADEVAAIVVEPIQGEGGYVVPEDGFLQGLRELCDRHGILLIADEIQSGAGRTGKMWAVEHWGVEPDILLTAKGIASGMPFGAMVARADLLESWGAGAHGSTYGGNPVACAAALATIRLLEGGLVANAGDRGERRCAGCGSWSTATTGSYGRARQGPDDRHRVRLRRARRRSRVGLLPAGLLVLECGKSTLRMAPALVVNEEEVETALRIFERGGRPRGREPVGRRRRAVTPRARERPRD